MTLIATLSFFLYLFISSMLWVFIILVIGAIYLLVLKAKIHFQRKPKNKAPQQDGSITKHSVAFFHPKSDVLGDPEKVLWYMVNTLLEHEVSNSLEIIIYTSSDKSDDAIFQKIENHFQIRLLRNVKLVRLQFGFTEASSSSLFTMLSHLTTSLLLTVDALRQHTPGHFIDTIGSPFSYWLIKFLAPHCRIGAYINSPIFREQDLSNLGATKKINNDIWIDYLLHPVVSCFKAYKHWYKAAGNYVDFVWTNSSWTAYQMNNIWPKFVQGPNVGVKVIYPPCSVEKYRNIDNTRRMNILVSVAQYTPINRQKLQLEILAALVHNHQGSDLKFYMLGTCRSKKDKTFFKELQAYSRELGVNDRVSFLVDPSLEECIDVFQEASYGIHTAENESFGISIVEMMAAGVIMVSHNSGGPKHDIIVQKDGEPIGFLAPSQDEFIKTIELCLKDSKKYFTSNVRNLAREEMERFSEDFFKDTFMKEFIQSVKI